ncbi:MAG: hypothetical protein MJ174_03920 [Treponema sp.]|nr:hypothetical protein [Treponema sp.]
MKKLLLSILLIGLSFFTFAMPGYTSYIPDSSGEYIFYRDNSFERESYIGFLYYNESTFQIKYFAPADNKNNLPEKTVAIAVSIDPSSNYWNMTGERILSAITSNSEDLDILNYLHDLLYEFSSKRIKAGNISPESADFVKSNKFMEIGKRYSCDYPQFGGKVTIIYDPLIPMFNVKSIIVSDGSTAFECVAIGSLEDSNDLSFDNFKGIPKKLPETKATTIKNAGSVKYTTKDGQSITLDKNWKQAMDNGWVLGDTAFATLLIIPHNSTNPTQYLTYVIRKLLANQQRYNCLENLEIIYNEKTKQCKITSLLFSQKENNVMKQTQILTDKNNNFYNFSLIAYNSDFIKNLNYFNKIIKSYSIK